MVPVRGLSLTQPWATLVALGAKRLETRAWSTHYRGLVAIHAASGFPVDARMLCLRDPFAGALRAGGYLRGGDLPRGAIVAVVRVTDCVQTPPRAAGTLRANGLTLPPPEPEASFGDFSPRRWAWRLELVANLTNPIPCRGALGLWDVPADVVAALGRLMGEDQVAGAPPSSRPTVQGALFNTTGNGVVV